MKTIFDFLSIGLFAGLAILYLQRSASAERDTIALWKYAVPAIGCGVSNYLGNNNQVIAAVVMIVASVIFSIVMLRPFTQNTTR